MDSTILHSAREPLRSCAASVFLTLAALTASCTGTSPGEPPGGGGETTAPTGDLGHPGGACSITHDVPVSPGEATAPAIAYGGGHFAVAWTDLRNDKGDIVLSLVDKNGQPVAEQAIAAGAGASKSPTVAALPGGGFLVGWQDANGAVRAQRVGENGAPSGLPIDVGTAAGDAHPEVAASQQGAAIAWMDGANAYVSHLGDRSADAPNAISGAGYPALAPAGDRLGLVYAAGNAVGFSRLTMPPSAISGSTFRSAPGRANLPRLSARDNGSFDVVWEDNRDGEGNETVYFARVGADGKATPELVVPKEKGSANYPDVASIGQRSAVVYYQFRDGPPAVYLAVIEADRSHPHADLRISGDRPARFARIARANGELGIAYAERDGRVRLATVSCE